MEEKKLIQRYDGERISEKNLQAGIEQNRDYFRKSLNTCLVKSGSNAGGQEETNALSRRLDQVCDYFLPHYTKADQLALQYQKFYKRGSFLIYVFALLAVLTVTVQALFRVVPHWTILIEIISIICIIFIIEFGNRRGWHRRWIDYRFLAERFRCAIFMALVGEKVYQEFSDHDLYHLGEEDNWIFTVFSGAWKEWGQKKQREPLISIPLDLLKRFIQCGWLEDQKGFHQKTIDRHERRHKQLSWTGLFLFYLTLVIAIIHWLHLGGDDAGTLLTFFAIAFPTVGLTFTALRAHFEHSKLVRRSKKMVNRISAIEDALEKSDTFDKLLFVCRQMEILMLSESTEWHGLIGFHHLEPPA